MQDKVITPNMVNALRYWMSAEDSNKDFVLPTQLKEVPSITSNDSVLPEEVEKNAELRRYSSRD